jgi:hypothetical protein
MSARFRKIFLLVSIISSLLMGIPAFANDPFMGGSRWCFGKKSIVGNIDLKPDLFSQMRGIKEKRQNIDSISDGQLQKIAADVIQPYIDKRLSVTVNGKTYPVRVDKITRNADSLFTIWLSVNNVSFDKPINAVEIVYSLLFEETNNAHTNLAFGYLTDARGAALQKVFDYSPPVFQTTFAPNRRVWEVLVKGPADVPVTEGKTGQPFKPETTDRKE